MKIKSFEFNLRELAGSMGDFGTLFPLIVGYITVCKIDPTGILVMLGLGNIITGIVYRLPMPIQPMKMIAIIAITQHWSPSMVFASGFSMGIIWIVFALTGVMNWIAKITPMPAIRGVQVALGVLLIITSFKMISSWWLIGIISILITTMFRKNNYAPPAILLLLFGIAIMIFKGQIGELGSPEIHFPPITKFNIKDVWRTLLLAGFAQVPLTAVNAVIATSLLIRDYWPEKYVSEQKLSLNMGIMNVISPFFGGMPLCHGAGGLAGQYYFGARTGGANIIEGVIEVLMGLFLSTSIAFLFTAFPIAIIGSMLFIIGIELIKFAKSIETNHDLLVIIITVLISILTNMALGFISGLIFYYFIKLTFLKIR